MLQCRGAETRVVFAVVVVFASNSVLFSSLPEDIIMDKVHLDCILNVNTNTCFVVSYT